MKKATKKKNHQGPVVASFGEAAKKRSGAKPPELPNDSVAASYEPPPTIEIKEEHQKLLRSAEADSDAALVAVSGLVIEQMQIQAAKHLQLARALAGDNQALRRLAELEIECVANAERRRKLAGEAAKKRADFESVGRQIVSSYGVRVDQPDGGVWNLDTGKMVIQRTG